MAGEANLIVDLQFWDDTTIDFTQTPSLVSDQTANGNNFYIVGSADYTTIGATRFSGNVKFKSELRASHAYYIHGYL